VESSMYDDFYRMESWHWWFVARRKIVLSLLEKYLPRQSDLKILDVGCGTGLMLEHLRPFGAVEGMDSSQEAISYSKRLVGETVWQGALPEALQGISDKYDIITALDVIEHIEDDLAALRAISGALAPGGRLLCTVPAFNFLWSAHDTINHHKRRYRKPELQAKLQAAGLTVKKISYYNTLLFPLIAATRMLGSRFQKKAAGHRGESDVKPVIAPINFALCSVFGFEKHLLKAINLPFGVSLIAVAEKRSYGNKG